MKQLSITLLIILACVFGACSSDDDDKGLERVDSYIPLIKEGKKWYYSGSDQSAPYPVHAIEYIKGDTLIGGIAYYKLYRRENIAGAAETYRAAFREEGKKVYCVKEGSTTEMLAYDFGLSLGESFTVSLAPTATDAKVTALTMENSLNGNQQVQRCSQMTLSAESVGSMRWVEGVGNLKGVVYYFVNRSEATGGEFVIYCYDTSTGQVLYNRP